MKITVKEADILLRWFYFILDVEGGLEHDEQELANKLNDYVMENEQNI